MSAMKLLNAIIVVVFFAALQLALTWLSTRPEPASPLVLWGGAAVYAVVFLLVVGCVWKTFDEGWLK